MECVGEMGCVEAALDETAEFSDDNDVIEFFLEPIMDGDGVAGGVAAVDNTDERSIAVFEDMSSMICSHESGSDPGLEVALPSF